MSQVWKFTLPTKGCLLSLNNLKCLVSVCESMWC